MTTISANAVMEDNVSEVKASWGWFVALGVGLIIAGLVASANLFLSTLLSVIYIAGMMLAGAVMQVIHAFSVNRWKHKTVSALSAILYGIAGGFLLYDPVLSALNVTLIIGAFMIAAGVVRIGIGFRERANSGWGWIVASGIVSVAAGLMMTATWPAIGLWFLGLMLAVDLVVQGWGFLAFGVALRAKK
jgi:uncharacterized membrane protein HdeD (DUF308 family)